MVLSFSVYAETTKEGTNLACKIQQALATNAGTLRQKGIKASDAENIMLKASKDTPNPQLKKILENLTATSIVEAYGIPIQPTPELQQEAITNLANNTYNKCINNLLKASQESK